MRALIIGAGPAGLTAALVLRSSGWHVRLVEEAPRLRTEGFSVPVHERGQQVLASLSTSPWPAVRSRCHAGTSCGCWRGRSGRSASVWPRKRYPTRGRLGLDGRRPTGHVLIFPTGQAPGGDPWRVDGIDQIGLSRWSVGNVMLIGDAAAACGAGTGYGTTVALVMGYEVATGLTQGLTLDEIEAQLRPWVTKQQAAARRRLRA